MKNVSLFLFFLCCTLTLSAQEKEPNPSYAAMLKQGELLIFGDKAIKFKEVVSDSRCPKDVACVWAGEAKVLIEVYGDGNLVEERIVTVGSSSFPLNFSAEDSEYFLNSSQLLPYPTTKNNNLDQDYTLRLMVNEDREK